MAQPVILLAGNRTEPNMWTDAFSAFFMLPEYDSTTKGILFYTIRQNFARNLKDYEERDTSKRKERPSSGDGRL